MYPNLSSIRLACILPLPKTCCEAYLHSAEKPLLRAMPPCISSKTTANPGISSGNRANPLPRGFPPPMKFTLHHIPPFLITRINCSVFFIGFSICRYAAADAQILPSGSRDIHINSQFRIAIHCPSTRLRKVTLSKSAPVFPCGDNFFIAPSASIYA